VSVALLIGISATEPAGATSEAVFAHALAAPHCRFRCVDVCAVAGTLLQTLSRSDWIH
jgi:hypothetical protein